MKLLVIGLGQCGSRIADEFAGLNARAKAQRGIEIVTGAFAINTDIADLSGLRHIPSSYNNRIVIGGRKACGHGVGKINEVGAELAREDGDKVINAIRTARNFFESDAFLLIASAGGGTGSGSLPVITQLVKDRYGDKPVYTMVVFPFEHEESTEERTIYNTATCLKSIGAVSDAVFLVDNQRYVRKDFSLRNNMGRINEQIAEPFYDLLCAGEEKKQKYIGAKVLDAGDINQTLSGWTVLGSGQTQVRGLLHRGTDFITKSTETHRGIESMDEALSELSLNISPPDAARVLYLISAPQREMNVALVKELGDYLRSLAPNAIIRCGDYPREKDVIQVTVIMSALSDVERIRKYYLKAVQMAPVYEKRQQIAETKRRAIDEAAEQIPSLIA